MTYAGPSRTDLESWVAPIEGASDDLGLNWLYNTAGQGPTMRTSEHHLVTGMPRSPARATQSTDQMLNASDEARSRIICRYDPCRYLSQFSVLWASKWSGPISYIAGS